MKIFCVGMNKTGTTSLEAALGAMGYALGDQREAERKTEAWVTRDFRWLADYCRSADAFQDVPFSLPFTFVYLDQIFAHSKFILTERDTPGQWYDSLVGFHARLAGVEGRAPRKADLVDNERVAQWRLYEGVKYIFGTPDDDLYNEAIMTETYLDHNRAVREYFKYRPQDFLTINVSKPGSMQLLGEFLGHAVPYPDFPHLNRTSEI